MRYILCENGYIEEVSFGGIIECNGKGCTEYTGAIPEGFESLEEWADNATIQAYKIVDGNLALDNLKQAELEALFEEEAEANKLITNKELEEAIDVMSLTSSNSKELEKMLPERKATGTVAQINDAGNFEFKNIKISPASNISGAFNLFVSGKNILANEAVDAINNGIEYTINDDRTISASGTAIAESTLLLAGSTVNIKPLFVLKANKSYYLSNLPTGVSLRLYNYDGSETTLVFNGAGGLIKFTSDYAITRAELIVAKGTKINTDIAPMLAYGTATQKYEEYKGQIVKIRLETTVATGSYINIEDGEVTVNGNSIDSIKQPCTFYGGNIVYTDCNANLEVTYVKSDLYDVVSGTGVIHLTETYASTGAINKITIKGLTGGNTYTLVSSRTANETNKTYKLNLSGVTGTCDIVIDKETVSVKQGDTTVKNLDDIYITTYDGDTYISLSGITTNVITVEYMLKSTFTDCFITRSEQNASIEITNNSITSIVENIGADGEVTASSIIQAINEDESSITISADKIDITGSKFPTLSNGLSDDSLAEITTLYTASGKTAKGIKYTANYHEFIASRDFKVTSSDEIKLYSQDGDVELKTTGESSDITLYSVNNIDLNADSGIYVYGSDFIDISATNQISLYSETEILLQSDDKIRLIGNRIYWNGTNITDYFDQMADGTL